MNAPAWGCALALASSGAALMVLAAPPANAWPLGLVAWLPLAVVASTETASRAALIGWLQGVIAQASVMTSLPGALQVGGGTSRVGSLAPTALLILFEGGRSALVAWAAARATRNGWPFLVSFPAALVAAEWAYPMVFPWTTSLLLQDAPVLLQAAELGGPFLISLWAGVLNASIACAWVFRAKPKLLGRYAGIIPLGILAAVIVLGSIREATVSARAASAPVLRVGIVQANVSNVRLESREPAVIYGAPSADLLHRHDVDLLIWPETALSRPVAFNDLPRALSDALSASRYEPTQTMAHGQPGTLSLLTGVVLDRWPPESPAHVRLVNPDGTWHEEEARRYNSAVLATAGGRVQGVYDKEHLLAFGEYIPGEEAFPVLRHLMPHAGTFSPGASSEPLVLNGRRLLVLICYEDIMPEFVRASVQEADPDLLVNLTSDSWFGASRVPWLHLGLARLRAIEHRRYFVRATNTGVSAVFDVAGRIVEELPSFRSATAAAPVRLLRSHTLYESIGNSVAWVMAAAAIVFVIRKRRYGEQGNVTPLGGG